MTKIALVADKNTVACFKLAGLKDVYPVKNAEEAEKNVRELSEKTDITVLLITERLIDQIDAVIENITERKYPLIVPIPDMGDPVTMKTDLIIKLIRSKVGIEVKL